MPHPLTVNQWSRRIVSALSPIYGDNEARWMARIIFTHLKGWNQTQMLLNSDNLLDTPTAAAIDSVLERMKQGTPIQYVLGSALFFGMEISVTPDVLIPRPETEQLVQMVLDDHPTASDLSVADIGTGSGCIAIALARYLRFPRVTAVDISQPALDVARRNATRLHAPVTFVKADALSLDTDHLFQPDSLDIVVSNPPYITRSEAADMDPHVLDHEPHLALFVPDSDPLLFYSAIARFAATALREKGRLYFEINPLFAEQTADMLRRLGFTDVLTINDAYGRRRFTSATRP